MKDKLQNILLPGKSTLGVMGSGQLGRMFAQKALQMGYSVKCYSPDENSPAGKVGVIETVGAYSDSVNLEEFLESIDALTFEFENIPEEALNIIESFNKEKGLPVSPSVEAIRISQNRFKEKSFFNSHSLNTAFYLYINSLESFYELVDKIKFPCILKTNQFGYDGKGQGKFTTFLDLEKHIKSLPKLDHLIEEVIDFSCEISIIAGRFESGRKVFFPPSENIHKNHILDFTIHPAIISKELEQKSIEAVEKLLDSLNYVGVLALELFVSNDQIICNEFAPRPHNSGHFTLDSAKLSQFELQVLTLCNLEIETTRVETKQCIMKNIIGFDFEEKEKIYTSYLKSNDYKLHLYQKSEPKIGRKMGHWNYLGNKSFKEAFAE